MSEPSSDDWLARRRYWVVLGVGVLVYVAFLGQRDLWYPDEPDLAEVCRAMFVSGDWIVPRQNGEPWIDYWPALYWAGTASSHLLGGMSEFSLRLPSAVAGVLLALWTCAFASKRFGPRAGAWSGLLLLTFPQLAYNATSFRPDALFSLFLAGGLMLYASGIGERTRWWPRVGAFALFGVAVLVKGPLGLLLPGFVLTLWHGSRREWRRLFEMAPLTVVALAVALSWAFACANATSAEWFWGEIHAQNFARFEAGARGHAKPWHYYLTRIWVDLAPWSVLLPFAVLWAWRSSLHRDRFGQLVLWWFGASLAFFSIAVTKRQLYLMPVYPAIAMLLGGYIGALAVPEERLSAAPAKWLVAVSSRVLAYVGVAAVFVGITAERILGALRLDSATVAGLEAMQLPVVFGGAAVAVAAVWAGWRRRVDDGARALSRLLAATVIVYVVAFGLLAPAANGMKTYVPECRWISEQIGPDEDRLGVLFPELGHHKMGAFGYYTGTRIELLENEEDVERFFEEHPGSVVLAHVRMAMTLFASDARDWEGCVLREMVAGRRRYFVLQAPE